MEILEETERIIKKLGSNKDLDQHFLVDENIIDIMIDAAEIKPDEVVLEIGPGTGNITKKIAKQAKKVIAIEIDKKFKPILKYIKNTEVLFGNALDILKNTEFDFDLIIANMPFQLCESIFQAMIKTKNMKRCVLIVPRSFYLKFREHSLFSSFFKIEMVDELSKECFYPEPNTTSVIVKIVPK